MKYYIKALVTDFLLENINKMRTKAAQIEKCFKIDNKVKKLSYEKNKIFHTFVMKLMFLCKLVPLNIFPGVLFLSGRVREPNENYYFKLVKIIIFLNSTIDDMLTLEADNFQTIK